MFSRVLEIYSVEEEEPVHTMSFDSNQTSFTYLSPSQLVVSDDKGRMSVFSGVSEKEGVQMRII